MSMSWRGRLGMVLAVVVAVLGGLIVAAPSAHAATRLTGVVLAEAGSVWCWGRNTDGQLGDGTTVDRVTSVPVQNLTGASQVSCGDAHTCALNSNGTVWCWGGNRVGQLGDGTRTTRLTPVQVVGLSGVTQISSGGGHTCARRTAGTAWCWGDNDFGQLGDGTTLDRLTPGRVAGLTGVAQASAGEDHTCVRLTSGAVRCWGSNSNGQLGDGTRRTRLVPVAVRGLPGIVTQVQVGNQHSCARRADGTVWCWGRNDSGQLGDGTTVSRLVATKSLMSKAVEIAGGGSGTCARTSANRAKCWGRNGSGQLGNGTVADSVIPVAVVGLAGVSGVSAGGEHTCAVLTDTTVRCWGANEAGQLGSGTTQNSLVPTPVQDRVVARAVREALSNAAATPMDIVVYGDSVGEGMHASAVSKRWADLLRARLRTDYPVPGVLADTPGYIPAFYSMADPWLDWAVPTLGGTARKVERFGLGGRAVELDSLGESITFTGTGTVVEVHYLKSDFLAGSFTITIDDGAPTTITTHDASAVAGVAAVWTSGPLSNTSHRIVAEYSSGFVSDVLGCKVYNGDRGRGVHVWDASHGGWTADIHQAANFTQLRAVSPDLAIVSLGFNDAGGTYPPAVFAERLGALVARIRANAPDCYILVLGLYNPRDAEISWDVPHWDQYIAAMAGVAAATTRADMLDLSTVMPDTWADPSLYADQVHPNDAGHALIANEIAEYIATA